MPATPVQSRAGPDGGARLAREQASAPRDPQDPPDGLMRRGPTALRRNSSALHPRLRDSMKGYNKWPFRPVANDERLRVTTMRLLTWHQRPPGRCTDVALAVCHQV